MLSDVTTRKAVSKRRTADHKRLVSGLLVGLFGLVVVGLGGWWFTIALGVIVHLGLLEFFRMAQFKGMRPATKTTLVACQLLLISTQWSVDGGIASSLADAVLPLSGAAICGWLLLQPITGSIADIAASIFGLFYLGFLPSHWLRLRNLQAVDIAPLVEHVPWHWVSSGLLITLMACLMVVASDIGALADSIRDGENGNRVPPGDVDALALVFEKLSAYHPNPQPLLSFKHNLSELHQELDQAYDAIICSQKNKD